MADELGTTENPKVDEIRRKLLRTGMIAGGGFVLGSLPYAKPQVKSFFGQRAAFAQPTPAPPACSATPNPLDFGDVQLGATVTLNLTYCNVGGSAFDLTSAVSDNAFFVPQITLPITLTPGACIPIPIEFRCNAAGTHTGTLSFKTSSSVGAVACADVTLTAVCS